MQHNSHQRPQKNVSLLKNNRQRRHNNKNHKINTQLKRNINGIVPRRSTHKHVQQKFSNIPSYNSSSLTNPLTTSFPTNLCKNQFFSGLFTQNARFSHNQVQRPTIKDLFQQLNDGLSPMLSDNPGMKLTINNDEMEIFIPGFQGAYFLQADGNYESKLRSNPRAQLPLVMMISPYNGGAYSYFYDNLLNGWVSVDDGHFLQELMTRELLKVCYGYPHF